MSNLPGAAVMQMNDLAARLHQRWRPSPASEGIDMGNGLVMPAEDVLDGHAQRLRSRYAQFSAMKVGVQVDDNLVAAITVLAPDLAPLTELAEEVAEAVSPVQPAAQFRQNLHEALERTHRQHAAQRVLGTRSTPTAGGLWHNQRRPLLVGGVILALLLIWRLLICDRPIDTRT